MEWSVRHNSLGDLAGLPEEVLEHVFLAPVLSVPDLLALSRVSRILRVLCSEDALWMKFYLLGGRPRLQYKGSWKATACMAEEKARHLDEIIKMTPPGPVAGFTSPFLYRRWYRCHMDVRDLLPSAPPGLPYLDGGTMTADYFDTHLDWQCQPAVLKALISSWKAASWTPESLCKEYGDAAFKANMPVGGNTYMRLSDFFAYCQHQVDEEPLYVFDSTFGDAAPAMLEAYNIPHVFQHDLFTVLGERAPDYRWLVVGPPRSGSSWHIDPNFTSAWNALLYGRKRWALYPPHRVPPGVTFSLDSDGAPDFHGPHSLQWFLEVYPLLAEADRPLEVVQEPGEVIFVPRGWWHLVLNLEPTAAITQNFCSPASLAQTVECLAKGAGPHFRRQVNLPWRQAHVESQEQDSRHEGSCDGSWGLEDGSCSDEEEDSSMGIGGFGSCGRLGPWLGALYQSHPSLWPEVQQLSDEFGPLQGWMGLVRAVCHAHSLPQPAQQLWPLCGGDCVVYRVGDNIIKFFADKERVHAIVSWQAEALLYSTLEGASQLCSRHTPCLHAYGVLPACNIPFALSAQTAELRSHPPSKTPPLLPAASIPPSSEADTSALCAAQDVDLRGNGIASRREACPDPAVPSTSVNLGCDGIPPVMPGDLPYIVTSVCLGDSIGACRRQLTPAEKLEAARQLGSILAIVHQLPLPRARSSLAAAPEESPAAHGPPGIARPRTPDRAEAGRSCCAGAAKPGCADDNMGHRSRVSTQTLWQDGEGNVWTRRGGLVASRGHVSDWKAAKVGEDRPGDRGLGQESEWGPFLGFLAMQRRETLARLDGTRALPQRFSAQFPDFIPEQLRALVGLLEGQSANEYPGDGTGGFGAAWLHGDLTSENVLINRTGTSSALQVQLIDYADCGHGDPLYDLVMLHLCTFRGDEAMGRAFLQSYVAATEGGRPKWLSRRGHMLLSHVAMCYTLLHEQDALPRLFLLKPELWDAASLSDTAHAAWGWLDTLF